MENTGQRETKTVTIELTDKERSDYGREAAKAEMEIARLEEDRKKLNTNIRNLRGSRHELLKAIEEGAEERTVETQVWHDQKEGLVKYLHNGDIVASRPMEDSDRQMNLGEKKTRTRKKTPAESQATA